MSNRKLLLLATVAMLAAVPAKADNLKFYSGGAGYTGPFSGPGTIYNNFTTNGVPTTCANNGACGTDVITASQVYGVGTDGLTATATNVWDDNTPQFGGLGVGTGLVTENDNIDGTDILTIKFNVPVELTGVATLFDVNNHGPFGDLSNIGLDTFLLNGKSVTFSLANIAGLSLLDFPVSDTYTFRVDGNNPSFYVSGLTFIPGQSVTPTPLPGAVWLFGGGIGGLAMLMRRKKKVPAEAAA